MNKLIENRIVNHIDLYSLSYIAESELLLENVCAFACVLDQTIDYISYHRSGWGNEFRGVKEDVNKHFQLISNKGRSTTDYNTYFYVKLNDGTLHSFNIMYSGNWQLEIVQDETSCEIKIGYTTDFKKELVPSTSFTTFEVAYIVGTDLTEITKKWQDYVNHIMLDNQLSRSLPVTYNHWWAYEDKLINEQVFIDNLAKAKQIGVEAMVLDAGWFGNDDHWFDIRGDWNVVDKSKFSKGISFLSQAVHDQGMKFGFWIEIEGVGTKSMLHQTHPQFIAKRNDQSLNYLCFGNDNVVLWAIDTVRQIIKDYQCDWIKFDFNLDPGLGCDCLDHGHQANDGLDSHVQGLYRFFEELHIAHPDVVFENCSSGGQRADLKLLSYFHCNFLSDPDNVLHKQRCIMNASEYMPPNKQFHFMPSQTCGDDETRPFKNSDLQLMNTAQRKEITRMGMLTFFGISHRLIDYSNEVLDFLTMELSLYKTEVRRFIQSGYLIAYKSKGIKIYKYLLNDEVLVFIFASHDCVVDHSLLELDSEYQTIIDLDDRTAGFGLVQFADVYVKTYHISKEVG